MPLLASILYAWFAVHLFVSAYSLVLYLRLRSGLEYAGYALASFGMAVYTMGSALLVVGGDLGESVAAQRMQFVGIPVGHAGFVLLLYALLRNTRRLPVPCAFAWGALALVANLSGLFFDPGQPNVSGWATPEAALLPAGAIYVVGSVGLTIWKLIDIILLGGLRQRDLRQVFLLTLPSVAAWFHDSIVRTAQFESPLLVEHATLLSSVGVSYVLLGRFIRLDEELRDRTRELRHSYDELQLVQEELVRKEQLAAVGELSAVIANEVKSPLGAIRSAVDGLSDDSLPASERGHLLGTLDEETDRLNRLVRDLLAYARPVEPQIQELELAEVVRKAARGADERAEAIRVDVDLSSGPQTVPGDDDLLTRALAHLVENAIQAMPAGGTLTIRSSRASLDEGTAVALSVHDTGEGMDPLVRDKARDPFFTTRPSGTGLGLAIVERVVQAHGGTLELDSHDGRGTTVRLVIPAERQSGTAPPPPDERLGTGVDG